MSKTTWFSVMNGFFGARIINDLGVEFNSIKGFMLFSIICGASYIIYNKCSD